MKKAPRAENFRRVPSMRPTILCLVILALLGIPQAVVGEETKGQVPDDWTVEHFGVAQEAAQQNDFDKAAEEYQLIISHSPKFAGAYLNLGIIYHQQRLYSDAVRVLKTAVSLDSQLLGAQLILGIDEYLEGDFKSAVPHLKAAQRLKPSDRQAGFYLGLTYIGLDEPLEAAKVLRKIGEYYPDDLEVVYQTGMAYLEAIKTESKRVNKTGDQSAFSHWALEVASEEKNDPVGVTRECMKALALDPSLAELYLKLAITLRRAGLSELAENSLQRYQVLRPEHKKARAQFEEIAEDPQTDAVVVAGMKEEYKQLWDTIPAPHYDPSAPALADRTVNQALKAQLASPSGPVLKTSLKLYFQGDYQGAARSLAALKTPKTTDWVTPYLLASAYSQNSDYDAAERVVEDRLLPYLDQPSVCLLAIEIQKKMALVYLSRVLAKQPDSLPGMLLLAKSQAAAGKNKEALETYEEALKVAPNQLGIHLAIGEIHEARLEWTPAIEEFRKELDLDPANAMALAHMGHALTEARQPDEAIPVLEKLLKTNSTDGEAYADLGKDWEGKGESEKAAEAYARAITYDPTQSNLHYKLFQLYRKLGKNDLAQKELAIFKVTEAEKHKGFQQGMAALKKDDSQK